MGDFVHDIYTIITLFYPSSFRRRRNVEKGAPQNEVKERYAQLLGSGVKVESNVSNQGQLLCLFIVCDLYKEDENL